MERGILGVCCGFSGAHPCVGVISIKLQSGFVEMALLRGCLPVGLLRVCGASFLEKTSEGLLVKTDNFTYAF